MENRTQTTDFRKPSPAMNTMISTLLRSPLHRTVSNTLMLITFTGRKTGQQFTTPVSYVRDGNTIRVFSRGVWWKNLQGGANVTLRMQGKDIAGVAVPVTDPAEIAKGAQTYLRMNGGVKNASRIGLELDRSHEPTLDELTTAAQQLTMIRITIAE